MIFFVPQIFRRLWWTNNFRSLLDASFSESLYGLRRRPVNISTNSDGQTTGKVFLTRRQRLLSLLFLVTMHLHCEDMAHIIEFDFKIINAIADRITLFESKDSGCI